jgi:hypothetical protein
MTGRQSVILSEAKNLIPSLFNAKKNFFGLVFVDFQVWVLLIRAYPKNLRHGMPLWAETLVHVGFPMPTAGAARFWDRL